MILSNKNVGCFAVVDKYTFMTAPLFIFGLFYACGKLRFMSVGVFYVYYAFCLPI